MFLYSRVFIVFQPKIILKKQKEVFIPAGTPICQIIPFKKDSWNHKIITNVSNKYLDKFNHILNDYLSKRFINPFDNKSFRTGLF